MPALFIYWLYKKPNALLCWQEEKKKDLLGGGGGGQGGADRGNPPPQALVWGMGSLGKRWALGVWITCFLEMAGILPLFMKSKLIMACTLQPWDGEEDIHSWGLMLRKKRGRLEVSAQKEIQQV